MIPTWYNVYYCGASPHNYRTFFSVISTIIVILQWAYA